MNSSYSNFSNRQRGAALAVGLILLAVLTLLAVAGMNTASVEFLMAGNEQYHSRAFNSAEAGIEQALDTSSFQVVNGWSETIAGVSPSDANDRFTALVTLPMGVDPVRMPISGNSFRLFWSFHFQIASTGTSIRNSQAVHTQEVMNMANQDLTYTCNPAPCPFN